MWLISQEKASEIRQAIASGAAPTASQMAEHTSREVAAEEAAVAATNLPRNMTVAGHIAEIRVDGLLTPKPDLFAWLFGGGNTTYAQIQSALGIAAADPSIREISLVVSSPGGTVAGLFETLAAIESVRDMKKISVKASQAASAAYAIAAVAGRIEAKTRASSFGSVGVAASFFVDGKTVDITSTEAPHKRPDVTTDEGKAVVREQLDAIHELFVDAIARGRGKTVTEVNETFGRGSVLLADEAKRRGMIDKAPPKAKATGASAMVADTDEPDAPAPAGASQEKKRMDLQELKSQHRELYEAVRQEGFDAGVTQERDRVNAHLTFGKNCGALDIALKAVADGAVMTQTLTAEYMTAGRNKVDIDARGAETQSAAAAVAGATQKEPEAEDLGDKVLASLLRKRGEK
jgi:ClpP class serine protease